MTGPGPNNPAPEDGARLPGPQAVAQRARLAARVGAGLSWLSREARRGSGSVVGGHAILLIEPRALSVFSAGRRALLVSGTNGKTTTTKLLAGAVAAVSGQPVVTNLEGANLPTGLAATLACAPAGRPAVLEVDEAWLSSVTADIGPEVILLLNLSRDQLDRNNEVRQVAQRWRSLCEALPPRSAVVANADDPLVAWAAEGAPRTIWVGAGLSWRDDASGCPRCGGEVAFGPGGDGAWQCGGCGFSRPALDLWLEAGGPGGGGPAAGAGGGGLAAGGGTAAGAGGGGMAAGAGEAGPARAVLADGTALALDLRLPGRCNQANAVMALGAVVALGYPAEAALPALCRVGEVGGRYATVAAGGTEARLLLAKNPAGWAEVFDMLAPAPAPVVVAINARTADGHDPSWLWDVPFERLTGRRVVATGERYRDLAVRLHYAGIDHLSEPDLGRSLHVLGAPRVDVVANYTAFHQLRRLLATATATTDAPPPAAPATRTAASPLAGAEGAPR